MPIANFKCVREVSSEDAINNANNLLKRECSKKWKTKNVGEKSAYVILELEQPTQIIGIDIGNEHSAFAEVLVSNKGCANSDFTEILITCSFMTPFESKSSTNSNRVRFFNKDALVETAVTEKWRFVKIICTQPFNKHVQYGISFVKLHTAENEQISGPPKTLVPEKFLARKSPENYVNKPEPIVSPKLLLREESDSDPETSTSLFMRWKKARLDNDSPTITAAIRQASTLSGLKNRTDNAKLSLLPSSSDNKPHNKEVKIRDRNRDDLTMGKDENNIEDSKLQRLSRQIEMERKNENCAGSSKKDIKTNGSSIAQKQKSASEELVSATFSKKRLPSRDNRPTKKQRPSGSMEYRPFNQLFRGVVLVISGIQNPDRANLRSKALALGAKYKADWEQGCTHLICAFKNTPKYNQVKGKGKIVNRKWIEKCYDLKKYLPWRRYALDSGEQTKPESDSEIADEASRPLTEEFAEDNDGHQLSCSPKGGFAVKPVNISSGSDTDDDIQRITQKNKENTTPQAKRDIYDLTTEEEEFMQGKTKKSTLFFKNLKFVIASNTGTAQRDQLTKCIQHYGGSVAPNISEANFFIGETSPNEIEGKGFRGEVVRSQWIWECNDMETKVPTQLYLIGKS